MSSSTSTAAVPSTPPRPFIDTRSVPSLTAMEPDAKKLISINNLMSPPEQEPFDNFPQVSSEKPSVEGRAPLSPPVSPFSKPSQHKESSPISTILTSTDPILYPNSEASASPQSSLFDRGQDTPVDSLQAVEEHITARPQALFQRSSPPEREDYELALYFRSAVMQRFIDNPKSWLRKERDQLREDRRLAMARNKLPIIMPAPSSRPIVTRPASLRTSNPNKVKKPAALRTPSGQTNAGGARAIRATPTGFSRQPVVRSTIRVSSTPEPRIRTVAPSREDKDFASLDDYCPPLDSLPNKTNSLKVDWKGNALDLSTDPHAHLLHPDELLLAAGLRLDCATYLTSKRRIFIRRLECARIGKEFRKTDAQQACKIDVNKASKLWTAYDKVGWLSGRWMKPFL